LLFATSSPACLVSLITAILTGVMSHCGFDLYFLDD